MSRRPIEEQAEADAARLSAEGLRDDERARLWGRIEQSAGRARRRRVWLWLGLGLPAAAAAAAMYFFIATPPPSRISTLPMANPCEISGYAPVLRLPAGCRDGRFVYVGLDAWFLQPDAVVEQMSGVPRVVAGRVRFHIAKRPSRFRVRVSHGEVEVVGTVFEVVQRGDGGSVTVSEGVIEFVWRDGTRERVIAGQRLVWPRAAPEPVSESETEPARASPRSQDLEPVLERLLQLQSQRRFDEAVVLLRRTLDGGGLRALQRERISYELGLALEASAQPSCAHWRAHVKRFGGKRHAETLGERLKRCDQE